MDRVQRYAPEFLALAAVHSDSGMTFLQELPSDLLTDVPVSLIHRFLMSENVRARQVGRHLAARLAA